MTAPLRTSLDFGLGWAERGVKIHPLIPGTNRPLIEDWPNQASSDPEKIRKWVAEHPACGWGGLTGSVNHHALGLVIDPDTRRGDGPAELREWLASQGLVIPEGMWAHTPNGGLHIYLATPPGVTVPTRHLPSVDFLGDGHYAALPPTRARLKPRTFPPPDWAPGHDQLWQMLTPNRPLYEGERRPRLPELYGTYALAGPPQVALCPPELLEAVSAMPSRPAGSGNGGGGGHGGSMEDPDELPPTEELLRTGLAPGWRSYDMKRLALRLWRQHGQDAGAIVTSICYRVWQATPEPDPFPWSEAEGRIAYARRYAAALEAAEARSVTGFLAYLERSLP